MQEAPKEQAKAEVSTQSPEEAFQAELERLRAKYQLPALWAAKFTQDGRKHISVCGVRKAGSDTRAEEGDLVHIGSCTKAMTGLLIADLVSRGSLRFDSTLGENLLEGTESQRFPLGPMSQ